LAGFIPPHSAIGPEKLVRDSRDAKRRRGENKSVTIVKKEEFRK